MYSLSFSSLCRPFLVLIHKQYHQLPPLAAKWRGAYELFPKVHSKIVIYHFWLLNEVEYIKIFQKLIKIRFISFQLPFLAAKWSWVYWNLPFWTCHISFGSKTWTLLLTLKILKLVLDVLHFILLPLCGCFTNKFIIKTRKSLVVLIFVLFCIEWSSNCFLKSINSAESWPFPSVWKKLSKV